MGNEDRHTERRAESLSMVLIELGGIKQITNDMKAKVEALDTKVGIQNGRVGKVELQQAFYRGAIASIMVLVLPVCLYVIYQVISRIKFA